MTHADLVDRVKKVFDDLDAVQGEDEDYSYALSVAAEDFLVELDRVGLEIVKK